MCNQMTANISTNEKNDTKVIFYDDFDTDELDPSKWNIEITGHTVNDEQQAYINSAETIYIDKDYRDNANGVLSIHPRYQKGFVTPQGQTFDFTSGRINTRGKAEFAYGSVSARILLPGGIGLWPAFWLLGSNNEWPACGELDIMEFVGEPDWTGVAIHGPNYSGETPLVNKKFFTHPIDANHWHIYSMDWTDSYIHFLVDDEIIYRVTRPMVDYYGSWVFDQKYYIILNFALGGTYPFKTNGISEPYYGLPEETVRSIQKDEIKLLVDWIKVTGW